MSDGTILSHIQVWRHFGSAVHLLALCFPVVLAISAIGWRRRVRNMPRNVAAWTTLVDLSLVLVVLGICFVTLLPLGGREHGSDVGAQLRPLASVVAVLHDSVSVEVPLRLLLLNIVLFVPLGYLLAARTGRVWIAVAVGSSLSLLIEVVQALAPLGRITNVDDVLLNTLGAMLGALAARASGRRWDAAMGWRHEIGVANPSHDTAVRGGPPAD